MKGKRAIFVLLILFIPLLTTGCWNRRELDKVGIVTAIGIDKGEDNKIEYTVQIIKPTALKRSSEGGSGQEKGFIILHSSGNTVFEAIRNLVEKSGRKLNYSHNMVIVLGENLAREGVLPVLDLFIRDHEMRLMTWIVVTGGKAEDIVQAEPTMENISAKNLDMLLKDNGVASKSVAVNLLDLFDEISDESLQAVVGRVELDNSQVKKGLTLKGAGVFRKDQLIGWLDPLKTRGYLWVRDKVKSGIITVPCPGQESKLISLEIKKAEASIKPSLEDGKMKYIIEVSVESDLGEQMCSEDLANPEMLSVLEDEQQKEVKNEVETSIEEAQNKFKADIIGLGEATMRKFPREWEEMKERWVDEFPNVDVEVIVKSKISRVGEISRLKMNK